MMIQERYTPCEIRTMTYDRACEILGLTTPKSIEANARYARGILTRLTTTAPIRHRIACRILIDAVPKNKL
jgi:hypothetical protein